MSRSCRSPSTRPSSRARRASSACGSIPIVRAPVATATVKVLLRTFKGEEIVKSVPIQIPANATGSLQLLVADASRLSGRRSARIAWRGIAACVAVDSHVQQGAPRQPPLCAAVGTGSAGPSSTASRSRRCRRRCSPCSKSDRNSGTFSPLRSATRGEWELPVELAISGSRLLTITLDRVITRPALARSSGTRARELANTRVARNFSSARNKQMRRSSVRGTALACVFSC